MKITQFILIFLPIASGLAACATDSPTPYRNVEDLARPPKIQSEPGNIPSESKNTGDPLGDKVYQFDSKPATLHIKLPFKKAWYAVRLALKEMDANIISIDSDDGVYLVNYKPEGNDNGEGGLLQGLLGGLLGGHSETSRYQILVKEHTSETEVTVSEAMSGKKEKYVYNPDGYEDSEPDADPEALFENLYRVLREDVVMNLNNSKRLDQE